MVISAGDVGQIAVGAAIIYLIGLSMAITAIFTARTSQGAIAWSMALIFIPFISIPLYLIFGGDRFYGYRELKRTSNQKVLEMHPELLEETGINRERLSSAQEGRLAVIERLADLPISGNNVIDLLIDGDATFDAMLASIDKAEDYLLFQYYIIRDDNLGRQFADGLKRAVKRGVRVYLLYDQIGCVTTSKEYFNTLRKAGIAVSQFRGRRGRVHLGRFQVNFRNHRKILVADGKEAFVGGHNIGDEYKGLSEKFGNWRDTSMKIAGDAVLALQLSFVQDWYWSADEMLEVRWQKWRVRQGTSMIVLPTGPASDVEEANLLFLHVINSARSRLWLVSPYFVPDIDIIAALELAVLRDVEVRLLVPLNPDSKLLGFAMSAYLPHMVNSGIKVYQYENGFMHQKLVLSDDIGVLLGTANLDNRSLRLNFEVSALIADKEFATAVEKMLECDFNESRRYNPENEKLTLPKKICSQVSKLFSPIL